MFRCPLFRGNSICGFDPTTGDQTPLPDDVAETMLAISGTLSAPPQS
jgi:hypothetical protein